MVKQGYTLTDKEHATFCVGFYEAQSFARILQAVSRPDIMEETGVGELDIEALAGLLSEKLKSIAPILGK